VTRAVIYWRPPVGAVHMMGAERLDMEEYDTLAEAEQALIEFERQYPWNTYTLALEHKVVRATQEWPGNPQITIAT
jgi:hypothetical protein